jgi:hypothetical protein
MEMGEVLGKPGLCYAVTGEQDMMIAIQFIQVRQYGRVGCCRCLTGVREFQTRQEGSAVAEHHSMHSLRYSCKLINCYMCSKLLTLDSILVFTRLYSRIARPRLWNTQAQPALLFPTRFHCLARKVQHRPFHNSLLLQL